MAKLSHCIKNKSIPATEIDKGCVFCGHDIKRGGYWSCYKNISVCEGCQNQLVDLLIDTLNDTMGFELLSHEDRLKYLSSLCEVRLLKKKAVLAEQVDRSRRVDCKGQTSVCSADDVARLFKGKLKIGSVEVE